MTELTFQRNIFGVYVMKHEWLYNLGRAYAAYLRAANAPHKFQPGGRSITPALLKFNTKLFGSKE